MSETIKANSYKWKDRKSLSMKKNWISRKLKADYHLEVEKKSKPRSYIKNKSGYKGVYFEAKKKLYRVVLGINGGKITGGRFKNVMDAIKRYNELSLKYRGKFAFINKLPIVTK